MWVRPKDYKVVGNGLAEARQRIGKTQQQLARELRKPQSFVSSYERGQRRIDLLEFIRVADALELDPTRLFRNIIERLKSSD